MVIYIRLSSFGKGVIKDNEGHRNQKNEQTPYRGRWTFLKMLNYAIC